MINFLLGVIAGAILLFLTLLYFFVRQKKKEIAKATKFQAMKAEAQKKVEEALAKLVVKGKLLIDAAFRNDAIQVLDFTTNKAKIKYKYIVLDKERVKETSIITTDIQTFLSTFTEANEAEMENLILPNLKKEEAQLAGISYEEIVPSKPIRTNNRTKGLAL